MSKFLTATLALTLTLSAASAGSFSFHDYLQKRFHPESVKERDVEGLDQHIRDGKLVLDLKAFLSLVLKNSTDVRLTLDDVYHPAYSSPSTKAPFITQILKTFITIHSNQTETSQIRADAN